MELPRESARRALELAAQQGARSLCAHDRSERSHRRRGPHRQHGAHRPSHMPPRRDGPFRDPPAAVRRGSRLPAPVGEPLLWHEGAHGGRLGPHVPGVAEERPTRHREYRLRVRGARRLRHLRHRQVHRLPSPPRARAHRDRVPRRAHRRGSGRGQRDRRQLDARAAHVPCHLAPLQQGEVVDRDLPARGRHLGLRRGRRAGRVHEDEAAVGGADPLHWPLTRRLARSAHRLALLYGRLPPRRRPRARAHVRRAALHERRGGQGIRRKVGPAVRAPRDAAV